MSEKWLHIDAKGSSKEEREWLDKLEEIVQEKVTDEMMNLAIYGECNWGKFAQHYKEEFGREKKELDTNEG